MKNKRISFVLLISNLVLNNDLGYFRYKWIGIADPFFHLYVNYSDGMCNDSPLRFYSSSKYISSNSGLHNWSPSKRFCFSFQLINVGMTLKCVDLSKRNEFFISFHVGRSPTSTITNTLFGAAFSMQYLLITGSAKR